MDDNSADGFRDGKFILTNTNKLLTKFSGTDGLKTGYYRESGFNIVATAKHGDFGLLSWLWEVRPERYGILLP